MKYTVGPRAYAHLLSVVGPTVSATLGEIFYLKDLRHLTICSLLAEPLVSRSDWNKKLSKEYVPAGPKPEAQSTSKYDGFTGSQLKSCTIHERVHGCSTFRTDNSGVRQLAASIFFIQSCT